MKGKSDFMQSSNMKGKSDFMQSSNMKGKSDFMQSSNMKARVILCSQISNFSSVKYERQSDFMSS